MHLELTMKQAVIRRTVRKFAEERLAPRAVQIDASGEFPLELAREMAGLDYFGLEIPPEFGGAGLDSVSYTLIIEEISRASAAMGVCVSVHNSVGAYPIYQFGTEAQRRSFLVPLARGEHIGTFCLTEPNAGSDVSSLETTAIRDGDSYILNGNKIFVTNGGVSETNLVFAVSNPSEPRKRFSVFIVESSRPGLEKGPIEDLLGMRGNAVCSISFHDCRIPVENRLGEEGQGLKMALSTLDGGRLGIAAQAIGLAEACLENSLKYAGERYQFGAPLTSFGTIQGFLADMATRIDAARLLLHRACRLRDQKQNYSSQSAMAKLFSSELAVDCARVGVQIHGGYGCTKPYAVERFYRDAKICEIYEGASEVQRMVIARHLLNA